MIDRKVFKPEATFSTNLNNILAGYDDATVDIVKATAQKRCDIELGLSWEDASPLIQSYYVEEALAALVGRYVRRSPKLRH